MSGHSFSCEMFHDTTARESLMPLFSNSQTHWLTKLDLNGIISLVCYWCPSWGKKMLAYISPSKVTQH